MGGWIRKAQWRAKGLLSPSLIMHPCLHAFLHSFARQGSTLAHSAVVSTTVNENPVETTPRVLCLANTYPKQAKVKENQVSLVFAPCSSTKLYYSRIL